MLTAHRWSMNPWKLDESDQEDSLEAKEKKPKSKT